MAVITLLDGDLTLYDFDENRQGQGVWTGAADGTRTLNEVYSAIQKAWDDAGNMDQPTPIKPITPTQYQIQGLQGKPWYFDDETVEHFTGGSLFSSGWVSGTNEYVLLIGADFSTAFSGHDIGRTVVGGTTGDTATLMDYNSDRGLLWIRPVDPSNTGDEFDHPTEAYSIQDDPVTQHLIDDNGSYTDDTTDANSATSGDMTLFPATEVVDEDGSIFGYAQPFSKLVFDNSGASGVQGIGGAVTWQYWNGTAWTALSGVTDGTTGFTAAKASGQEVTWTAPSDWARQSLNGGAQLYHIRANVDTVWSTDPVYDQVEVGGQGAGNFQVHARHGGASAAGESAWAGVTSIGAIADNTKAYLYAEDPDAPAGTFEAIKVSATKGTDSWWPQEGHLDICLKTKEAGSVFGPRPGAETNAISTALMRQFSDTYSHFVAISLGTAGGETVIPFGTGDDLNVTDGYRQFTTDAEVGGGWSSSDVDTVIRQQGSNTAATRVWQVDATGPSYVDETTDFNSATDADVTIFPATEATGDYFSVGYTGKFNKIIMDNANGTAGTDGVVLWEYSTGDGTWADLESTTGFTDGTSNFTAAVADGQVVSFIPPTDWSAMTISTSDQLYWVRARITTIYTINPVYDQGFVVPELDNHAVITSVTGTGPIYTVQYYLIRTGTDFVNNDVVETEDASKSMTLDANATDVNAAALAITPTFAATTEDINNGSGAAPYSIRINPASNALTLVYPRLQYLTRRLSTTQLLGINGEAYLGNESQVQYSSQAGGNFVEARKVYDQTTDGVGVIAADHDDGTSGDLILQRIRGTITAGNTLSDSPDPTQTLGAFLQVASAGTIVDETTDATSAGGADVTPFPGGAGSIGDYFVIGAAKPWATAVIDVATAGTGSPVLAWEYWNGTAWSDIEADANWSDGTTDLTTVGVNNVVFYPPLDWAPHTLADGTASYGPLYMIRGRITTTYTADPVLDEVSIEDNVTATIGTVRTIVPVAAAPFGTFAGGKLFGAPGVTLTTANLAGGDEQAYQLIDDDGTTQIPPNTISVSVDNLVTGDFVAIYRRSGDDIVKDQFSLAAANDLGDTQVDVDATIGADNPTNAHSKVRLVSASNQEHRYRYASYSGTAFTLSTATVGTDDGNGTLTTIVNAAETFETDGVEPGDMVRNTTDGVSFSEVVSVDSETTLTVTNNGVDWNGQGYSVNTLVENYPTGQNAYVPLIERQADAGTESNQLVYSAPIDVRAVVRRAGLSNPILPFSQDTSITGTLTVTTIRNDDTIIS